VRRWLRRIRLWFWIRGCRASLAYARWFLNHHHVCLYPAGCAVLKDVRGLECELEGLLQEWDGLPEA
jgi:hypothetical protein